MRQQDSNQFDVLIIGGGPGGMSAAIWCADLGLSAALIEKNERLGGQLWHIHNPIVNYPGVLSIKGDELAATMIEQVRRSGTKVCQNAQITALDLVNKIVSLADGTTMRGYSIIVATGVRRRKLCVPGEDDLLGKGILSSGALERTKVRGRKVLIVGGGDASLENALILSEEADSVMVVHRGSEFSARQDFVRRAEGQDNVRFVLNTRVTEFVGQDHLSAVRLINTESDYAVPVDFALIRIGVEPNSDLPGLETGKYFVVDNNCETESPLVYCVGDVANQNSPTIATAVGMAATAAKNMVLRLSRDGEKK